MNFDVADKYPDEIARGTAIAEAAFGPEIWTKHGDGIVKEGKGHLYIMHVLGMASNPLACFLDGADVFVSYDVEGRESCANRFAPLYGRAEAGTAEAALREALVARTVLEIPPELQRLMDEELEADAAIDEEADAAIARAEEESVGQGESKEKRPKRRRPGANSEVVTEDAVALRFAEAFSDTFRHCHTSGAWYKWGGSAWAKDRTNKATSIIREIAREMSAPEPDKEQRKIRKASFAAGADRFARADRRLAVISDFWDSNPMLLGTPGGTVDLTTGVLRPSDPVDGITKLTAVAPSARADAPLWLAFLDQATKSDPELIRFLQQWCGYCLTGDISEHALLFVYGGGGNGKGVFLNTVAKVMRDYHVTAAMETFTASNSDRHPTDLAGLCGARLVAVSETEEGRAWAESKIKSITGGDEISARFMRQDFFDYIPQFKLTIIGNHKPRLRNVDDAAKRRFNFAPFVHKPISPDPYLERKLIAEWPGILRWAIDGCLDWQKNRLVRPKVVTAATAEYFEDQDSFRQWLEERCCVEIGNDHLKATSAELFESWSGYAKANGTEPGRKVDLGERLRHAGLDQYKSGSERGWKFVSLLRSARFDLRDD